MVNLLSFATSPHQQRHCHDSCLLRCESYSIYRHRPWQSQNERWPAHGANEETKAPILQISSSSLRNQCQCTMHLQMKHWSLGWQLQKCFNWFLWWMISTNNSSMNELILERFNVSSLGTNLTVSLPVFSLIFLVSSFTNFCMLTFISLFSCGRTSSFKCSHFCLLSLHTVLKSGEHSHFRYVVLDFSQSAVRMSKKVAYDVNGRVMFCFYHRIEKCFYWPASMQMFFATAHFYVSWCGTSDIKCF